MMRWISSARSTLTDEPRPVHVPLPEGGRDTAKLTNRARYIATRPGVEVLRGEHSGQPATKKQQAYIQRLLRDFPGAEELLEYEDYQNAHKGARQCLHPPGAGGLRGAHEPDGELPGLGVPPPRRVDGR